MGVGLRKKSLLGQLPYTIEPRAIEGRAKSFAVIRCDFKGCEAHDEINADAPGRLMPLEAINKKFSERGWNVHRGHNRCPEHNGKKRKVLTLTCVPAKLQQQIVDDPVAAVADTKPIKTTISLSHIPLSKVDELSTEMQLAWYKQALERERKRGDRLKREANDLIKVVKPIAEQARKQFSGIGVVWQDEVSFADRHGVSLSINFEHLKNAVRVVDGVS